MPHRSVTPAKAGAWRERPVLQPRRAPSRSVIASLAPIAPLHGFDTYRLALAFRAHVVRWLPLKRAELSVKRVRDLARVERPVLPRVLGGMVILRDPHCAWTPASAGVTVVGKGYWFEPSRAHLLGVQVFGVRNSRQWREFCARRHCEGPTVPSWPEAISRGHEIASSDAFRWPPAEKPMRVRPISGGFSKRRMNPETERGRVRVGCLRRGVEASHSIEIRPLRRFEAGKEHTIPSGSVPV